MSKKIHRVTITWADKTKTVIENATYLSYEGGGLSFMSDSPKFVNVHGLDGYPVEIFQMDAKLKHLKLEEVGTQTEGSSSGMAA